MDRAALERLEDEALAPAELAIVREWCRAMWLSPDSWPDQPPLVGILDLALHRVVNRYLEEGRARSETHAIQLVAGRYGLNPETIRKRWQRYRNSRLKNSGQNVPHDTYQAA